MDDPHNSLTKHSPHSIKLFTKQQKSNIKGHLIDSNNKLFRVFPSFSPLNPEFILGSRVVDIFPDRFSFNLANKGISDNSRTQQLDNMTLRSSSSSNMAIVVTDASVKNNIATSISHIHAFNQPIIKTVHHAAFITSTEAKLFTIRCGINQACSIENISKIIIVTDSIHTARKIFDNKSNPYQIHSTAVLRELRHFFATGQENSIEFWKCPSCLKWRLHKSVDKESKLFNPLPSLPSKISWDFCRKTDSNNIINLWKMTFQASDGKGKNFLDLADINNDTIELSYIKGGPWLQPLVPPTLYVLELQEPSQTMPLQENINYDFSRRKTSSVRVVYTLSRQEGTFCMNVRDIMGIGTLEEIHSTILSCS